MQPWRRGYRELLVLFGLLAFGSSMTGSFWVVFLFTSERLAPAAIAALLGTAAFVAVLVAMGMGLVPSVPVTPSIVAGLGCLAGMQLALAFLTGPPLYVMFSILYGAYIPLFFLPWNTLVTTETRAHDRGAKLAGIVLANAIAVAGAPFLGGLVARAEGFRTLFLSGAAVLGTTAVLAARFGRRGERVRFHWDPRALGRGTTVAYAAQGGIDGILWTAIPLATFSFVQGTVELGALFSIFAVTGGVFAVALGRWSDAIRLRPRFIALGATVSVPLAMGVAIAPSLAGFTGANGALNATLSVAPTFVTAAVVDRLEPQIGLVMLTREVLLNLARGSASIGILALFLVGMPVQLAVLIVAALLPFEVFAERFR